MNLINRFRPKSDSLRMLHNDTDLLTAMGEKIISWLPEFPRDYVAVCIGTDRSTGDALGPLTGTFFSEMKPKHITIYGTLHEPVHAMNLENYIKLINNNHKNPYIIAIDACLGKNNSVGYLITGNGPIKPGAALNKPLPPIGDLYITGVVNVSGFMEQVILQNTRLSVVTDMSKQIASLLNLIDERMKHNYSLPSVIIEKDRQKMI
ncbi:putative sporulation protein YyaC [Virgibacillus natechei]|uniref:Sporulation protein YyaC n=1 Tax=Virgibacillus natechei TaxID=1216297 RepID=A0ABS4IJE1_9BACI|nr:spore protease YyaC [Virgibacillus natechei]MBP1971041.1 putative sporulation protein YyaC [Virgibacillus natechei]UZD12986.1 spore protease YyaC [Virgibacillus natechei]